MALKLITRAVSVGAALMALAACLEAPQGGGESLFAVVSTVSRPVGDPLPQAFVLTAIVIALAVTVLMLAMAVIGHNDDTKRMPATGETHER